MYSIILWRNPYTKQQKCIVLTSRLNSKACLLKPLKHSPHQVFLSFTFSIGTIIFFKVCVGAKICHPNLKWCCCWVWFKSYDMRIQDYTLIYYSLIRQKFDTWKTKQEFSVVLPRVNSSLVKKITLETFKKQSFRFQILFN